MLLKEISFGSFLIYFKQCLNVSLYDETLVSFFSNLIELIHASFGGNGHFLFDFEPQF